MSDIVSIEVTEAERAYLDDKYGEGVDVTPESHTLNKLAKKLWSALPAVQSQP